MGDGRPGEGRPTQDGLPGSAHADPARQRSEVIEKTRGEPIDLNKLPLDDRRNLRAAAARRRQGVFQLESDGIRELLKRLKPDNIRDIIALMALYRPGPLEAAWSMPTSTASMDANNPIIRIP